jgi:hypothetical protein
MNLLVLLESMNLKIRQSDVKPNASTEESQEIQLYKHSTTAQSFKVFIEEIESEIQDKVNLSFQEIGLYAKQIVNMQCFVDGNHRTALALCYYLSLVHNHQLLRIKPYLLYAAIDFEYFKHLYGPFKDIPFFSSNAIEIAMASREQGEISSKSLQKAYFEKFLEKICSLATFLENLKIANSKPHSSSTTQQIKLFSCFSGCRENYLHSTSMDPSQYLSHLHQKDLLSKNFNPKKIF